MSEFAFLKIACCLLARRTVWLVPSPKSMLQPSLSQNICLSQSRAWSTFVRICLWQLIRLLDTLFDQYFLQSQSCTRLFQKNVCVSQLRAWQPCVIIPSFEKLRIVLFARRIVWLWFSPKSMSHLPFLQERLRFTVENLVDFCQILHFEKLAVSFVVRRAVWLV